MSSDDVVEAAASNRTDHQASPTLTRVHHSAGHTWTCLLNPLPDSHEVEPEQATFKRTSQE